MLVLWAGGQAGAVVQRDDQAGARDGLANQPLQDVVAGHLGDEHVVLAGEADGACAIATLACGMLCSDVFAQALGLRGPARACQHGGQFGFDDAAGLEDVARLLHGRLRDEGALVGHQCHELLMRQPRQHLADAGPACAGGFT